VVVSELASGSSYTLSYSWSPTIEEAYNITAYVLPVENETSVANNIAAKFVTVAQPLIHPLEGQYANYTMYYGAGLWNITYIQYVSPYQINVTTWMRDPSSYTQSGWMIVNIFTRMVERDSGISWKGMWYPGWIETNVTLGSTIKLLGGDGTIVDSRVILVGVRPIECWEIHTEYYGYLYKFWYDKASGLWIAMEYGGSPEVYLILTATNVPIGFLYEHDLAVMLDTPPHLQPSESTILNATAYNMGLSDEANIVLQIIIDGTVVDNVTIGALPAGGHFTLPYPWAPTVEAIYNVTAYAAPVSGENYTLNNIDSATVNVCNLLAHDVAVTAVETFKTVYGYTCHPFNIVYENYSVSINATVENQGDFTETFDVTAKYDDHIIGTIEVTLAAHTSTNAIFTWDTTGIAESRYTISVVADLPGDADPGDNTYTDGVVTVTLLGDTDGDFDIDEDDLWGFCAYFITYYTPGKGYMARSILFDFDENCKIDEDDLWTFCAAFNNYYKWT
jgi:hypothetical protein